MIIHRYSDYLRNRYGDIVYRVPLDAGFCCPHRDRHGNGGCIFCAANGSRAVQIGELDDLREQLRAGVAFARKRYQAKLFMAYLQAFTPTFASLDRFSEVINSLREGQEFCAFSVGTRPDCLSREVMTYLARMARHEDVWVELGVQTIHDETLRRINRGHDWITSKEAVYRLNEAGIFVAVHVIIGLPGESIDHFRQTMDVLAELPVDGIKLHNLHVIKKTRLARWYNEKQFQVMNEYEYMEVLLDLLPRIPLNRPIIRLTTDTPDDQLIAPRWTMSKDRFIRILINQMKKRGIRQGDLCGHHSGKSDEDEPQAAEVVVTEDGSITFWNAEFKEHYHTLAGARSEAEQKYCQPARLDERLHKGPVRILDVCFGLGYNSLSSCEHALGTGGQVDIVGLELNRNIVRDASENIRESAAHLDWNTCLSSLHTHATWENLNCSIQMLWGDARNTIRQLKGHFDLIWLDAFSTQRNSELWTVDFFRALCRLLKNDGVLLTYCAAIPVRSGMMEAGFLIGETEPFGRTRGGTLAAKQRSFITLPIPKRDRFLMKGIRGTPYRDPSGTRENKEILRAREMEILRRKLTAQNGICTNP
ncbi:MAG: TIGR01212 family radical SAM protein [Desulfobulbus propionicus]|nr:MAG: TIGR01212 family radical SAM protein [Desulfobulbus propionicus]